MCKVVRKVLVDGKIDGILVENVKSKVVSFVKKDNMGLYEYVNAKVSAGGRIYADDSIPITKKNNFKVLYHGSKKGLYGKIDLGSRRETDFGSGFYLNTSKDMASNWVYGESSPVLYTYLLDVSNLSIYEFINDDLWALFVALNRKEVSTDKLKLIYSYDVIAGNIADDRMFIAFDEFLGNRLSLKGLIYCLKYINLGRQWVMKTEEAVQNLFLVKAEKPYYVNMEKVDLSDLINYAKDRFIAGKYFRHLKRR